MSISNMEQARQWLHSVQATISVLLESSQAVDDLNVKQAIYSDAGQQREALAAQSAVVPMQERIVHATGMLQALTGKPDLSEAVSLAMDVSMALDLAMAMFTAWRRVAVDVASSKAQGRTDNVDELERAASDLEGRYRGHLTYAFNLIPDGGAHA